MAESNDSTRREPPLRRRERLRWISYTGSRAQLIEAGILTADDPLPGDPGQFKTYACYQDDPRGLIYIDARPGRRFTVHVERTQEEMDAAELRAEGLAAMRVADVGGRLCLVWTDGRRV